MSDEFSYHLLEPDNADLLLAADVFDNPVDSKQLAAFVADPGYMMVFAMQAGRVIGMASGMVLLHPDKQPAFFVSEVGVAEARCNQGFGARLTEKLMRQAHDIGCEGIWLATETDNAAARALYRKLGARETEDVVVYDWDGAMDT